jgi:hypothetical protein
MTSLFPLPEYPVIIMIDLSHIDRVIVTLLQHSNTFYILLLKEYVTKTTNMNSSECHFLLYAIHKGWLTSDMARIIHSMVLFQKVHLSCHYCDRALLTVKEVDTMKGSDSVSLDCVSTHGLSINVARGDQSTTFLVTKCDAVGTPFVITPGVANKTGHGYDYYMAEHTAYSRVAHVYSQQEKYFSSLQNKDSVCLHFCTPCWKLRCRVRCAFRCIERDAGLRRLGVTF